MRIEGTKDTAPGSTPAAARVPVDTGGECRLEFRDVSKWYGAITALMGVDFSVGREVTGLVGRNGAGKSTLLKVGAGLLRPSQGNALVVGRDAGTRHARALLGFCPDTDRLIEGLSGREFVAWMLRYHGLTRRRARARAGEVLDDLGLGSAMHRRIRTYSKGMRQRVRLAQALAHGPQVILLDEPMTGLDPVARSELGAAIRVLPERGVGVLVSSHVLHELEAIVDRVVFVHQGRVLAQGRVHELRDQLPDKPRLFRVVGGKARELAAAIFQLPQVDGVTLGHDGLRVVVRDVSGFAREMTVLAAGWAPGILEIEPLDEDLAFVFERYLS